MSFRRTYSFVAIIVSLALLGVHATPPERSLAGAPAHGNNNSGASTGGVLGQLNSEVAGFLNGGLLGEYGLASAAFVYTAAGAALGIVGWHRSLIPSIMRAYQTGPLVNEGEQVLKMILASEGKTYAHERLALRKHIDAIPSGAPFSAKIRKAAVEKEVDALLTEDVRAKLLADPKGKVWLQDYDKQREIVLNARMTELNASGLELFEGAKLLIDHMKGEVPAGVPFRTKFKDALTVWDFDRLLEDKQVVAYFKGKPSAEATKWKEEYERLKKAEEGLFQMYRAHYALIERAATAYIAKVDNTGTGYSMLDILRQERVVFNATRDIHHAPGHVAIRNHTFWNNYPDARSAHESLAPLYGRVESARTMSDRVRKLYCKRALLQLGIPIALLGGAIGANYWRNDANERVKARTGKPAEEIKKAVEDEKKEKETIKTAQAASPVTMADKFRALRADPNEKNVAALYALIRTAVREEGHLDALAAALEKSPAITKDARESAHFGPRRKDFSEKNDFADVVIDDALARLAEDEKLADPIAVIDLLLGADKEREGARLRTRKNLFPAIGESLWPGLVKKGTALPVSEKLFSNMKKSAEEPLEAVGAKWRTTPRLKPTDVAGGQ